MSPDVIVYEGGLERGRVSVTFEPQGGTLVTPANWQSTAVNAPAGAVLLLQNGSYVASQTILRSSRITLRPAPGHSPTFSTAGWPLGNITLADLQDFRGGWLSSSRDVWIMRCPLRAPLAIRDNTLRTVLDGGSAINLGMATWEGRVSINLNSHDTVFRNFLFQGNAGCSDGVFVGGGSLRTVVEDSVFDGILQGSCSPHCDAWQVFGSGGFEVLRRNLFIRGDTFIMAPDGSSDVTVERNVFDGRSSAYEYKVQFGTAARLRFTHNTLLRCGLAVDSKPGNPASSNAIVRDNLLNGNSPIKTTGGAGCSGCTVTNNPNLSPVFAGGSNPATYDGYRLAAGSPGEGAASDGTDLGI